MTRLRQFRFAGGCRRFRAAAALVAPLVACAAVLSGPLGAAGGVQPPEQFIGFRVGDDNRLVRWDQIVEYMRRAAAASDRVRFRELGRTRGNNPFVVLEISAPETLSNLDRFKQLERGLYFQGGAPTSRERDEILRQGKVVVLVTCSVHGDEIGATQMSLELVHRLATDNSPATRKILDNVILLLVPSANPDGQIASTDWFNHNLGTPYDGSPPPFLYHPYAGHDSNRDMYMLTQSESRYLAELAWRDWYPVIWLDEHQMGPGGPRMFVMPATDPINPNVHPLIYRWNSILGQSQAAALEAQGKDGIIHNSTYTNFWEGALAWSGWWHNQIGLLTEVASARVASPVDQLQITPDGVVQPRAGRTAGDGGLLPAPTDITPRTEYPRPWLGGRWTLRDIVDYELVATLALLETAADRREAILEQIYEVNRQTVDGTWTNGPAAIIVPVDGQHDPREAGHLAERLVLAGVEVRRAQEPFELDDRHYAAGTFVVPMAQVFGRYAKDLLEKQTYPEVRPVPGAPVEPPYDVTAWSLGMQFGVNVDFAKTLPQAGVPFSRVEAPLALPGHVEGSGDHFEFNYSGPDTAKAINRLLAEGARVRFEAPGRVAVTGVRGDRLARLALEFGLRVEASRTPADAPATGGSMAFAIRAPRVAIYSPWTSDRADEGWTRWVLEEYEFKPTAISSRDIREGDLRRRFDAVILTDQNPRDIVDGQTGDYIRPEYRGGIGEEGISSLTRFVADGGTLIALGSASELVADRLGVPVRDLKRGLGRDQHFTPGAIVRIEVDTSQPVGFGMPPDTYGFYTNGPLFSVVDGFPSANATVVARYPAADVLASGWLRGEELMAGQAAVVSIDMKPGRVVLFGLRPQHRAQTHATFPLLFNSLYLATAPTGSARATQ